MKNVKLTPCKNCGNPFFQDENKPSEICENCILLEERKKRTAPFKLKQDEVRKEIKDQILEDLSIVGGGCPICGSPMEIKDGCIGGTCSNWDCAFSECG